jgi:hypothetical protein
VPPCDPFGCLGQCLSGHLQACIIEESAIAFEVIRIADPMSVHGDGGSSSKEMGSRRVQLRFQRKRGTASGSELHDCRGTVRLSADTIRESSEGYGD